MREHGARGSLPGPLTTRSPGGIVAVVELAKAFASTLSDEQFAALSQHYSLENAANWSNFPQAVLGRQGRVGLRTGTLSAGQWPALNALLAGVTGSGAGGGF